MQKKIAGRELLPNGLGGLFAIWFLVLVAYFPVFQNRFVYDEHALVIQNERILRLSEIPGSFFRFEADTSRQKHKASEFSRYRPVPEISGILAGQVFGLNPVGWHSVNLMLFFATTGIVFIVLRRIFPDDEVAIAGSALFALHPVNCEVVAWVVLFGNTLWGLFFWGAFLCHILNDGRNSHKFTILSVFLFGLALLSREAGIVFPTLIFLFELFIKPGDSEKSVGKAFRATLPYFGIIILYVLFRVGVLGNTPLAGVGLLEDSTSPLLTIPLVLWHYLALFFCPVKLSPVYSVNWVTSCFAWSFILPLGVLVATAICLIMLDRRLKGSRIFRFGVAVTGVGIFPFINLGVFQQDLLVQDRYLYISSLGVSLVVLEVGRYVGEKMLGKQLLKMGFYSLLLILCLITNLQTRIWKNDISLFTRAVETSPDSFLANQNLGMAFLVARELDAAEISLKKSLQLRDSLVVHAGLGDLASFRKIYPTAIEEYEFVKKSDAECPANVLRNLGLAYQKTMNLEKAFETFKLLAERFPEQSDGYFFQGLILLNNGDIAAAMNQLETAVRLNPFDKNIFLCLGEGCVKMGKPEEARKHFEKALSIDPEFSSARKSLDALGP